MGTVRHVNLLCVLYGSYITFIIQRNLYFWHFDILVMSQMIAEKAFFITDIYKKIFRKRIRPDYFLSMQSGTWLFRGSSQWTDMWGIVCVYLKQISAIFFGFWVAPAPYSNFKTGYGREKLNQIKYYIFPWC